LNPGIFIDNLGVWIDEPGVYSGTKSIIEKKEKVTKKTTQSRNKKRQRFLDITATNCVQCRYMSFVYIVRIYFID